MVLLFNFYELIKYSFITGLQGKYYNQPLPEVKIAPRAILDHHIAISTHFNGKAEDHPMQRGRRAAFRLFFSLTLTVTIAYSIWALPETKLDKSIMSTIWWFILWAVVLYMNLAYLLFLTNFWWRADMRWYVHFI